MTVPSIFEEEPLDLPEFPEIPEIPEDVLTALEKIQAYADQLEQANLTLSAGGILKQKIVDGIIPDLTINVPCRRFKNKIPPIIAAIKAYIEYIKALQIPDVPLPLEILLNGQIQIKLEIPSLADFLQSLRPKIELKRKNCIKAIIKKQIEDANKENKPFTNRLQTEKPLRNVILGNKISYNPTAEDFETLDDINSRCCDDCVEE